MKYLFVLLIIALFFTLGISQECTCECACCNMDIFDRIQNSIKNQVITDIFDIDVNQFNFLDVTGSKMQIEHLQ